MHTKPCRGCSETKPIDAFDRHPRMADGYLNHCKACRLAYQKAYNAANHDKVFARRKAYRAAKKAAIVAFRKSYAATPKGRAKVQTHNKLYAMRHPEKRRAHSYLWNHINSGKVKKQPCEVCGTFPAQAHHDDYSKPLDVRWLCRTHHIEHHMRASNEYL